MMSISALGAAGGDKAWYAQSQASDESRMEGYYQGGDREPPGVWQGRGLEALGLNLGDKVTDETFRNIIEGRSADGSDLGVQGSGENHRAGWDLTFSAPKSVSLAWAAADTEMHNKISNAHNSATAKALAFIEDQAAYGRRGKAGAEHEKLPGLAFATYQHADSREGDPQLHSHCLVMNMAQRADGTYGGIESKHIYDWHHASGAIYRAELAREMQGLGFQIKKDREFFRIAGIRDDITKHFSKRRIQIESALAKAGIATGKAKSSELASLSTRGKKMIEMTREVFLNTWRKLLGEQGLDAEKVKEISGENYIEPEPEAAQEVADLDFIDPTDDGEEDQDIFKKLTSNESIFREQDIYKQAAIFAQLDGSGAEGAIAKVQEALASRQIVHLPSGMMTTREMLKIESSMIHQAQTLRDRENHGIDKKTVDAALAEFAKTKGFSLSAEQEAAVRAITSAGDLKLVQGAAGSGKSTMAEAAKVAWESQGFSVIGAALAGKAAAGLQEGSGIESHTIHRTLYDIEKGNIQVDNKTVLLIDEAGMVGSRQMQQLTQLSEKTGAKLVLIGDQRQLQAVDAGGAFRALQNQLPEFAQLNEVRRQKNVDDKQAANDIAAGKGAEALKNYVERDLVQVKNTVDETKQALVEEWAKDHRALQDKIILAGTKKDVFDLNQAARSKMSFAGTSHAIKTANGARDFAVGDRIVITKNNKNIGVNNGNFGTVQSIRFNRTGELEMSIKIDGRDDLVKAQVTGKDAFQNIDHGYASTVHKSQGSTVDSAYFYAGSMVDKELGYVALSRHRESCQIFTPRSKLEQELDKSQAQATLKMQALAQTIAAQKNIDISNMDIQDFRDVRDFLNEHSDQVIETEGNDGWGANEETKQTLIALGSALERSNLKETTLDHISIEQAEEILEYPQAEPQPESEPEHEIEM
jgi:Ti-type conjugative transfer relaxase TraA